MNIFSIPTTFTRKPARNCVLYTPNWKNRGVSRIVFYGASDLAEIAYLSLQETNIELLAVFDDEKKGKRFMRFTVAHPDKLVSFSFDRILITSTQFNRNYFTESRCAGAVN